MSKEIDTLKKHVSMLDSIFNNDFSKSDFYIDGFMVLNDSGTVDTVDFIYNYSGLFRIWPNDTIE